MTQYDVIVELQKECSNWEAKYLKVTTEMYDAIQKLRAERDQLKEQKGIVENACQDWREKAESAESNYKDCFEMLERERTRLKTAEAEVKAYKQGAELQAGIDWHQMYVDCLKERDTLKEQKYFEIKASPELEKRLAELALDNLEKGERLAKAQELIAREWDSPTCIIDSKKIEEYEHCTCAEDYANIFVGRLKKALGG